MPLPKPKKGERTPGSGRKKGTKNKVSKALAQALDDLCSEPESIQRLRKMRDGRSSVDRSTFWRLAGKRVPTLVEAHLDGVELVIERRGRGGE